MAKRSYKERDRQTDKQKHKAIARCIIKFEKKKFLLKLKLFIFIDRINLMHNNKP